jgi:hypothetical protein
LQPGPFNKAQSSIQILILHEKRAHYIVACPHISKLIWTDCIRDRAQAETVAFAQEDPCPVFVNNNSCALMHEVDTVRINSLVTPPTVTDFNEHDDCTLQRSILFVRFATVFGAEIVKQIRNCLLQLVYYDHMLETCFSLAWIAHISLHPVEKIKHDFLLHIEVEVIKTCYDLRK